MWAQKKAVGIGGHTLVPSLFICSNLSYTITKQMYFPIPTALCRRHTEGATGAARLLINADFSFPPKAGLPLSVKASLVQHLCLHALSEHFLNTSPVRDDARTACCTQCSLKASSGATPSGCKHASTTSWTGDPPQCS